MLNLPWRVTLQRRPRPMPPEFAELAEIVSDMGKAHDEMRKMLLRVERKVYRDEEHADFQPGAPAPEQARLEELWRTGDPAL